MIARILQALFLVLSVLNFAWYIDAGSMKGLFYGVFFIVVVVTIDFRGKAKNKNGRS